MASKESIRIGIIGVLAGSLLGCGFYQSAPAPIENGWHPLTHRSAYATHAQSSTVTVTPLPSVAEPRWQKKSLPIPGSAAPASSISAENSTQQPVVAVPAQLGNSRGGIQWQWPAQGKVRAGYSASNKGIEISGKMGQPIYAAAPGVVLYAGSGLSGYGKLLIIKHNDSLLSAYAHNSVLLVKEGAMVSRGQKIALMGNSGSRDVGLHFEIRRNRQPVDPMPYLSTQ